MLTNFLDAQKTWVVAQHTDPPVPVGRLVDLVINPETGRCEALWVQTLQGLKLLIPSDVLRWNASEIVISDESDLTDPDGFPRLQQILGKEVSILGASVFIGKRKKPIGWVKNFAFDTISPRILGLTVRSGFWIFGSERIIPQSRIKKITEEGIFISDEGRKVKVKKSKLSEKEQLPEPELD